MQNEAKRKNRCSSIKEQKRQAEQVEKMLQSAVKMRQDKKNATGCIFGLWKKRETRFLREEEFEGARR